MVSRVRRLALALALAGAVGAQADPTEEDELKLDPDYAGGKKAVETKDWSSAIRLLSSAALRDTRNPDIQNYLGYAYRNSPQFDLAFKHYERTLPLNPRHPVPHKFNAQAILIL